MNQNKLTEFVYVNEAQSLAQIARESFDWIEVVDGSALHTLMTKYKLNQKVASNVLRDAFVTGFEER